jgi:hypothetical protein
LILCGEKAGVFVIESGSRIGLKRDHMRKHGRISMGKESFFGEHLERQLIA